MASTSSVSGSSSGASSSSSSLNLSLGGAGTPMQITGLASGLDTNSIVQEMMSIYQQPVTNLQNEVTGVTSTDTQLQSIQTALNSLVTNAQALSSTTLFSDTQNVTSSNTNVIQATTTSNVGAVVGGYQVEVSQLASAAQATYSFNSTASSSATSPTTITINPSSPNASGTIVPGNASTYTLQPGATAQDLVNEVNADQSGSVWATLDSSGNIIFSDRTTGSQSSFTVSDGGVGILSAQPTRSQAGTDATYSTDGGNTWQTSQSNTVTSAIPGVSLTFSGVTNSQTGPVAIDVSPPTLSTTAIQSALQTFVSSYNSVLTTIQTQLAQAPSSSDPTQGGLYNDPELTDLLNNMRQMMYTPGQGVSGSVQSMMDIGVSTGAASGTSAPSQTAISGQLTLDTSQLTSAITSNPAGVTAMLQDWSIRFTAAVSAVSEPGGTIDNRIQSDDTQVDDLNNQISQMQAALTDRQNQLTQEFANMESALSQNQSTSSWLTSQLSGTSSS